MEKGFIAAAFFVLGITTGILVYYGAAGVRERRRKKRELQERRRFQRIEELQSGLMEEKREELAKIRHDFNNQLAAAYRLIEQGERDSARGLLDHMRDRISANREYQYCGNAIVDAVIIEKEAVCREWHIPLSLELEIYEEQNIEPAHLCSVFSNLLDNGIQAAKECVPKNRYLRVWASRKGDYLHVKAENPMPEGAQTFPEKEKRYGHVILREIASIYEGEFWTRQEEGVYTACISLLAVKEH